MEVCFCVHTPILVRQSRRRRRRVASKPTPNLCIEPSERPTEKRGAAKLLRAPEAIAALGTVAFALFRDVLRGDGSGIRTRLENRLKAHKIRRNRILQIEKLKDEIAKLFEEANEHRDRINYYNVLAERCLQVVTSAKQDELLLTLSNAISDSNEDAVAIPNTAPSEIEQEFMSLLQKSRVEREQYEEHCKARELALKSHDEIDLDGAKSEVDAYKKLIEIRRNDLNNIRRSTEEAKQTYESLQSELSEGSSNRDALQLEVKRLREELAAKREELENLRNIVKAYEASKSEDNFRVPVATAEDADASEAQLRRLKREINAANNLAKKIVESARQAVKVSEARGDNSAAVQLGDELKNDIEKAQDRMKKLNKQNHFRERAKKNAAVESVLKIAQSEANNVDKPVRKKSKRKSRKSAVKSATANNEQVVESSSTSKSEPVSESSAVLNLVDAIESSKVEDVKMDNTVEDNATLENSILEPSQKGLSPDVNLNESEKAGNDENSSDEGMGGEFVENMFDEAMAELLEKQLTDDAYVEKVQELVEKASKEVDTQDEIVESTDIASLEGNEEMEKIDDTRDAENDENLENMRKFAKSTDLKSLDEAMANMSVEDALLFQEALEDYKLMQEQEKAVEPVENTVQVDETEADIAAIPSEDLLGFVQQADQFVGEVDENEQSESSKPWRIQVDEERTDVPKVDISPISDVPTKSKSGMNRYSFVEDVEIEAVDDLKLENSSFGREETSALLKVLEEAQGLNQEGIWQQQPQTDNEPIEVSKSKDEKVGDTKTKEPAQVAPKVRRGRLRKSDVEKAEASRRATNASLIEAQTNQMAAAREMTKRGKKEKESGDTVLETDPPTEIEVKLVKKRGRPRKAKTVTAQAVGDSAGAVPLVEKRKRGRPRKTPLTSTTTTVEEPKSEEVVQKKKRGRPRKTAVVTPVPVTEAQEEKPKRGRKKATTTSTSATASTDSETEEKPKRGRKRTVTVTSTTGSDSETEGKPKRGRKKAAAATSTTPTVATDSETEEKPKRSRKKSTATVATESGSEEKPKRKRGRPRKIKAESEGN